jgi:hypothetical protein
VATSWDHCWGEMPVNYWNSWSASLSTLSDTGGQKSYYYSVDSPCLNFTLAREECHRLGSELTSVIDSAENEYIHNTGSVEWTTRWSNCCETSIPLFSRCCLAVSRMKWNCFSCVSWTVPRKVSGLVCTRSMIQLKTQEITGLIKVHQHIVIGLRRRNNLMS